MSIKTTQTVVHFCVCSAILVWWGLDKHWTKSFWTEKKWKKKTKNNKTYSQSIQKLVNYFNRHFAFSVSHVGDSPMLSVQREWKPIRSLLALGVWPEKDEVQNFWNCQRTVFFEKNIEKISSVWSRCVVWICLNFVWSHNFSVLASCCRICWKRKDWTSTGWHDLPQIFCSKQQDRSDDQNFQHCRHTWHWPGKDMRVTWPWGLPEQVRLVKKFSKTYCEKKPVVFMAGNESETSWDRCPSLRIGNDSESSIVFLFGWFMLVLILWQENAAATTPEAVQLSELRMAQIVLLCFVVIILFGSEFVSDCMDLYGSWIVLTGWWDQDGSAGRCPTLRSENDSEFRAVKWLSDLLFLFWIFMDLVY